MQYVSVVGPGDGATDADLGDAHRAGLLLGQNDIVVITGGMGGVMAATARGVRDANGTSIGLLPVHDRSLGDPAHTHLLPTGLGEARNALVVRMADVVLAIGGSWGTLSEIALAVRTGKPVVAIRCWDLPGDEIHRVSDVNSAVSTVMEILNQ